MSVIKQFRPKPGEVTSTPKIPVENVVFTTKSLQERNTNVGWDDGGKIGKIIN